ncbi:hypothetical protein CPB83DRAFT_766647 [Crepidotus variabilis]|uniref:Uncharacterized protein n=1 Tax=Crepidotus variabilis TaxID=179855 RepID=A0A9P6EGC7_9AGAR|nr:hypothetical protein CPB83DRAFT_766647 [Crepidotus variabilis]
MSTTPPTVTRSEKDKENPAAVLRALLSRLPPNRDNDEDMETPTRLNPMPNAIANDNERYPFEKDSDYEVETASATHSVAQSSLKDIFSKALREPGDTPRKDRSALANGSASRNRTAGRRRRSSIGASEVEETPRIAESMTLKGKRKSMSEDELEHLIREWCLLSYTPRGLKRSCVGSPDKSKTRSRVLPQTLTKEFLRERFGSSSNSPTKPLAAAGRRTLFSSYDASRVLTPL